MVKYIGKKKPALKLLVRSPSFSVRRSLWLFVRVCIFQMSHLVGTDISKKLPETKPILLKAEPFYSLKLKL